MRAHLYPKPSWIWITEKKKVKMYKFNTIYVERERLASQTDCILLKLFSDIHTSYLPSVGDNISVTSW